MKILFLFVIGILLFACRPSGGKQTDAVSVTDSIPVKQQVNIRLINQKFPENFFYLHDSDGQLSCDARVDSVVSFHNDFRFLELKQALISQPIFWCRDSFDYELADYDQNKILRLKCDDRMANNEVNFFVLLDSSFYSGKEPLDMDMEIVKWFKNDSLEILCADMFFKKNAFLEKYTAEYPVSVEFYKAAKTLFAVERAKALGLCFLNNQRLGKNTATSQELLLKDSLLFRQDEMLFSSDYKNGAFYYNKALAGIQTGESKVSQLDLYRSACRNFTGETKNHLLLWLYKSMLQRKDAGLDSVDFFTDCSNENYKEEIRQQAADEKLAVQHTGYDLLCPDKKVVAWKDVLAANRGKLIYVDFWASWCAPCRASFPASRKLHDEYKDKEVVFVYISTDKNSAAWKKACQEEKMTDCPSNYCVLNRDGLLKDLKVQGIPRYVLYDKQGKLINANAPRPGTPEIRSLLDKYLK